MILLAISAGLLVAACVVYGLALRECRKAMRYAREARALQADVDRRLNEQLDTLARVEEWTT